MLFGPLGILFACDLTPAPPTKEKPPSKLEAAITKAAREQEARAIKRRESTPPS
jgi:pseudouridine-5'-phosphate glycosidase